MPMDGDSTSVSALSMIPIKLAGTSTSINHCVGNQFPQQMALKNISPETFSIPVSTTERLRAKIKVLLESFDVDALDKENTDDDDDEVSCTPKSCLASQYITAFNTFLVQHIISKY